MSGNLSPTEVAELRRRVAELTAENERLRVEADSVAVANVQAALEMVQIAEAGRLEVEAQKREVEHALTLAETASRHKSRFLAHMSHELRTPLGGIVGMAALLLDTELNPAQREYAQTIAGSAESFLELINQILDFSKIEADRVEIEAVEFDLWDLLERSARPHALRAEGQGLVFDLHIRPEVPRRLVGDPTRIRQVLDNLCGNAIKFTARGHVRVLAQRGDDGRSLELLVSDTGIGIGPEAQARLFEPFVQADSSTTRRFGGTGLGLAICRGLAQRLGGALSLRSQAGVGSEFCLRLPCPEAGRAGSGTARGLAVLAQVPAELRARLTEHLQAAGFAVRTVEELEPGAVPRLVLAGQAVGPAVTASLPGWRRAGCTVAWLPAAGDGADAADVVLPSPCRFSALADLASVAAGPGAAAIPATGPAASPPARRFPGARVLVAEDMAVNQAVIKAMLGKLGCAVTVVADGEQAVVAVREHTFDVVLMDCQMPVMDGFVATRSIRAVGSPVPIVALTANALPGDRERCLQAGMDDYLAKPVRREQLAATFQAWIPHLCLEV